MYTHICCKPILYILLLLPNKNNENMKKTILFLFVALIGQLMMADNNIDLMKGYPGPDPEDKPRSITEVTASIDGQVVTVLFSELTASQIVVKDSANLTVFNQTYAPAYSAQADLTSLVPGYYTLYIYAMGYWWYGQFEIE